MSPLPDRYLILIQKYFRDELSEIEKNEFDQAMDDSEFRAEVDLHAQVFEGLVAARREKLHAVIEEVKDELANKKDGSERNKSISKWRTLRWLSVAAVTLGIVCSLYYFSQKDNPDYEAMYAEYYAPYDTPESQRGNNEVKNSPLDRAMFLYENEEYAEALPLLNSISPKTDYTQLLVANCYLNLNRSEEATSVLKSLSDSKDIKIAQHAEWYLSMAYIKSNRLNLAREVFNNIKSTPDHLYHDRVVRLMGEYGM